jgi:hypothetical protein
MSLIKSSLHSLSFSLDLTVQILQLAIFRT